MRTRIVNSKPCTFITKDSPMYVADEKGRIFYANSNLSKSLTFNLPRGTYFTSQSFERKPNFEPYPILTLPDGEHYFNSTNFDFVFGDNPNKGTFKPADKEIFLDKKILLHPFKPVRYFVTAHEKGHSFFEDENKCDWFALNWCLQNGFNPLQIKVAYTRLFVNSPDRIKYLDNKLAEIDYTR